MTLLAGQAHAIAAPAVQQATPKADRGRAVPGVYDVKPGKVNPLPNAAAEKFTPSAATFPPAAKASAAITGADRSRATGTPIWAQNLGPTAKATGATTPAGVNVEVLNQATAKRLGIHGIVFTAAGRTTGKTRVGVDYAGFSQAYGGNYASRLRLVRLPACALTTPEVASCRKPIEIGSVNEAATKNVSAVLNLPGQATSEQDDLSSRSMTPAKSAPTTQPMLLAVTAGSGGESASGGTYGATDLSPSGSWSAGGNAGGFTYNYPVVMPASASKLVPSFALSYNSSGIDGQTVSTQAQANWAGDGWSTPKSFIEQTFVSCSDDPQGTASPKKTNDQCYNGPILTLSLNGASSSLIWDAAKSTWKADSDTGQVITKVTGSGNGSGTNDTSYWKVTTRDGTVHMFGRNQLPGWTSGKPTTNSVDTVPIYSPHSGDPCYNASGFDQSWCVMAYRWNLDYVVDVHGNAMSYHYKQDTNHYGRNQGATNTSYVRDSRLQRIDYGFTDGNAYGTVPNQVVFTTGDRCVSGTCQPLNDTNKANWPDVPYDLICTSGATCNNWSPSFFSTVRLSKITTQQWSVSASQYLQADSYTLTQTIPATGDGTSPTLWLDSIAHTGHDTSAGGAGAITLPSVSFASVKLQNRVDTAADGLPAFYRHRIQQATTESGSVITVTYDRTNPCVNVKSINAATNTGSCYPVRWTPPAYVEPITDWFNKYVVTKVTETDPFGGAPAKVTSYAYLGGIGWHYDDNELIKAKYRSYAQYRGYGKVQTRVGDGANDKQTLTEAVYYRGMSRNNNTTVVNLSDSQGGQHEDLDKLFGRELETTSYKGDGGPAETSTITSYWISGATASRTRTGLSALTAHWIAPVEVFTSQRVSSSGTPTYRYLQTDHSYDANIASPTFGLEKFTYVHTVPADTQYDTCTAYTYAAVNSSKNLVGLIAEEDKVSKACGGFTQGSPASAPVGVNTLTAASGVSRPDQVIANTQTFYDDPTWSTNFPQPAPSKGDVTMVREASTSTGGAYQYHTTSRSKRDSYGRIIEAYNGNGHKTITAFTMNTVGLTTSISTTNPLSQTSSQVLAPMRGLTLTATDINGVVTTSQYDALGRSTSTWSHSRTTDLPANYKFSYTISKTGVSSATTQKMNDSSGYQTSTLLYDAMLRSRQTQAMTPQGGRLVTDTFYDSRGLKRATYNGWWDDTTTPNTSLVSAANLGKQVANQDLFTYDGLARLIRHEKGKDGIVQAGETVTTIHAGDATTTFLAAGGTVQTSYTDPLGQKVKVEEYKTAPTLNTPGDTFTGDFSVTGGAKITSLFGYDGHDRQASITDAAGNTWTSTFNLLGQITSKTDPDAGQVNGMIYDGEGNLVQSTDSRGKTISYAFDLLGRTTGHYASTVAAQSPSTKLAEWVYDNSDNAMPSMSYPKGKLTSSTAYSGGQAYKTQHTNFNIFGASRGLTVTIPTIEGTLAGSYTFTKVYSTTTGLLLKDVFPAKGGLPSETVNYGYSGVFDMPSTLGGLGGYVNGVAYDAWSRVAQQTLGASPNRGYVTNTYDLHSGDLTSQLVTRETGTPTAVHKTDYSYDPIGNITKITETRLGSASTSETQCFRADAQRRMRTAWTATDGCAVEPTTGNRAMVGSNLGSSSAYWTTWTFNDLGERTGQTQHALPSGTDTTTSYTYNGNGKNQPHTLTSTSTTGGTTGSASFGYDTAGNMTTRNAGKGNQTITWDDAARLTAISGSTSGNTNFIYDADGNVLLQKDPGATTLYLPGQQITLNTAASTQTGSRYYNLPGGGTCIRTGTAANYSFAVADHHGTPTLYLSPTMANPVWRQYTPHGASRGTTVTAPDNRGFLNQVINSNTGLAQVGARNYDTATGRFISLDPVFDANDPQSWNGYTYGNNNPIDFSDPSGLALEEVRTGKVSQSTIDIINGKRQAPGCSYSRYCEAGNGRFTNHDFDRLNRNRNNNAAWKKTLASIQTKHLAEAAEDNERAEAAAHHRKVEAAKAKEAEAKANRSFWQKAGDWAWEHRGVIATVVATALCFAPIVGMAACAGLQAIAFAIRTQQTVSEKGGWEANKSEIILDGFLTTVTLGFGSAIRMARYGTVKGIPGALSPFGKAAKAAQTPMWNTYGFSGTVANGMAWPVPSALTDLPKWRDAYQRSDYACILHPQIVC